MYSTTVLFRYGSMGRHDPSFLNRISLAATASLCSIGKVLGHHTTDPQTGNQYFLCHLCTAVWGEKQPRLVYHHIL